MELLSRIPGDLWTYYIKGGYTMHFITICSVLGVTAIIYKLVVFHRSKIDPEQFAAKVRAALLNGSMKEAIRVCEQDQGPVPAVLKVGLLKYGAPRDFVEKSMENAAIHEVAYLEKYLVLMATVTNIAPLLGFYGTVVGMIISFDEIAAQGLNNPSAVAHGISVALITTAYGLIVAFIVQPFYNFFTGRVAAHVRDIETASNILFETFDEMEQMGTKA